MVTATVVVAAATLLVGCADARVGAGDSAGNRSAAVVSGADSGELKDDGTAALTDLQRDRAVAAEAALAGWLDQSREAGPTGSIRESSARRSERIDSIPAAQDCSEGDSYFPSPLLASWTLVSTSFRGDTIVARVMVTTVAEQDIDRRAQDRFVARTRVRSDVLEWDVIPTDDGWMVCNGIRFGYRGADSLTRWLPEGSSYARAQALADSVRKAQP